jgi:penicillin-binding protein 1B
MPATTSSSDARRGARVPARRARAAAWFRRWRRPLLIIFGIPALLLWGALGYYYVAFSRMIDARLQGERVRAVPRVFARAFELAPGDALPLRQMIDRLNELGYAHRARAAAPGEFAIGREAIALIPRAGSHEGQTVRLVFSGTPEAGAIRQIVTVPPTGRVDRLTLEPPLITAIETAREKRRILPLSRLPKHMIDAVVAIEDRRFYDHLGIDPIRIIGALLTNLFGDKPYLEGASTITQQLARNFFLTEQLALEQASGQRSLRRKLKEQLMAVIIEGRLSKQEILELYLNDVYLGQRGSFAIHGVGVGARRFFGKDPPHP